MPAPKDEVERNAWKQKIGARNKIALVNNKNRVGKPLSEEHKASIGAAALNNQHFLGKAHTDESKLKNRLSHLGKPKPETQGPLNPNWKGDTASLQSIHTCFRRTHPPPDLCEECHQPFPPDELEAHNVSKTYRRDDRNDWLYVCRPCHRKIDPAYSQWRERRRRDDGPEDTSSFRSASA